jgi:hypothetical protein
MIGQSLGYSFMVANVLTFVDPRDHPEEIGADIAMPRGGGNCMFVVPGGLSVDRTVPGVLSEFWLQMY